jgi:hypothetical protein
MTRIAPLLLTKKNTLPQTILGVPKNQNILKKLHLGNYIFGTYHQYYPKKLISNSVEIIRMTQPYD